MFSLASVNRIIIVTHNGPDDDSVLSTYVLLRALDIKRKDPRIIYMFVPKGKIYTPTEEEKKKQEDGSLKIFHIDTGAIIDPENGFFDHHIDSDFHCAAQVVAKYFWPNNMPKDIKTIVDLAIFRDTASEVGAEDDYTLEKKRIVNTYLRENRHKFNVGLRCVSDRDGPTGLSDEIHNADDDETEEEIMLAGLRHIQMWVNKKTKRIEMELFMDHFGEVKTIHGLHIQVVKRCVYGTGKIRNYVRKKHYTGDDIRHLVVIEHDEQSRDPYKFSIMTVQNRSVVRGMQLLFDELKEKAGENDGEIFFHRSKFMIHIYPPTKLQLNQILDIIRENLYLPGKRQVA